MVGEISTPEDQADKGALCLRSLFSTPSPHFDNFLFNHVFFVSTSHELNQTTPLLPKQPKMSINSTHTATLILLSTATASSRCHLLRSFITHSPHHHASAAPQVNLSSSNLVPLKTGSRLDFSYRCCIKRKQKTGSVSVR
jgi:hypothetical protein